MNKVVEGLKWVLLILCVSAMYSYLMQVFNASPKNAIEEATMITEEFKVYDRMISDIPVDLRKPFPEYFPHLKFKEEEEIVYSLEPVTEEKTIVSIVRTYTVVTRKARVIVEIEDLSMKANYGRIISISNRRDDGKVYTYQAKDQ